MSLSISSFVVEFTFRAGPDKETEIKRNPDINEFLYCPYEILQLRARIWNEVVITMVEIWSEMNGLSTPVLFSPKVECFHLWLKTDQT